MKKLLFKLITLGTVLSVPLFQSDFVEAKVATARTVKAKVATVKTVKAKGIKPTVQVIRKIEEGMSNPYGKQVYDFFSQKYGDSIGKKMMLLSWAESGWNPNAIGRNKRSTDRGLMQINSVHLRKVKYCAKCLFDVQTNLRIADGIFYGKNYKAWFGRCSAKVRRELKVRCIDTLNI